MKSFVTLFIALAAVLSAPAYAGDEALIRFELPDQFGDVYKDSDFEGEVLIVFSATRSAKEYVDPWHTAIDEALKDSDTPDGATLAIVANLKFVPSFMRNTITSAFFPKERRNWVLCDWEGAFDKAYDFEKGKCDIMVFGKDRRLIHRAAVKDLEEETLAELLQTIHNALEADPRINTASLAASDE